MAKKKVARKTNVSNHTPELVPQSTINTGATTPPPPPASPPQQQSEHTQIQSQASADAVVNSEPAKVTAENQAPQTPAIEVKTVSGGHDIVNDDVEYVQIKVPISTKALDRVRTFRADLDLNSRDKRHNEPLNRVLNGLKQINAELGSGRRVESMPDLVRWIAEQLPTGAVKDD